MEKFYAYIDKSTNNIIGKGTCKLLSDNLVSLEVDEEIYNREFDDKFKATHSYNEDLGAIALKPNAEEIITELDKARAKNLSMTPLDFIKALEKFAGITYAQVKELCDNYPEIDRELRFCQNVYRNNPMFSQEALAQLPEAFRLTDKQIDDLFIAVDNMKKGLM